MKLAIYDKKGKEIEKVDLPAEIFDVPFNADLVHQVAVSMASSARSNTAHAKDRSEVSGGGKKPWKQKGTGRARHGSTRSPIWVGGGTTHGPRNERNYDKKINKKVKAKSLAIILSQKARDNEIVLIDSLSLNEIKTKEAVSIINSLAKNDSLKGLKTKKNNAGIISLSERNENTEKSFRNISNLKMDLVQNLNISDLLKYKYLVLVNPKESFEILTGRVKTGKVTENNK
ncbi:50S ribosomal protein L4 [Candidatus Parcubacteria bacterium]|nr:50S ribosomal protein L4 [Candidatus Parcubacteria bacterium]